MPIFGWIRDLFGIQKDMYDTKRTRLEIKKLEEEKEKQAQLISLATLDDVKIYDLKYKALKAAIDRELNNQRILKTEEEILRLRLWYKELRKRRIKRIILIMIILSLIFWLLPFISPVGVGESSILSPKLLHSTLCGVNLPPVGVASTFRLSQDTLIRSRRKAACPIWDGA
jgi:hypothetical protein